MPEGVGTGWVTAAGGPASGVVAGGSGADVRPAFRVGGEPGLTVVVGPAGTLGGSLVGCGEGSCVARDASGVAFVVDVADTAGSGLLGVVTGSAPPFPTGARTRV